MNYWRRLGGRFRREPSVTHQIALFCTAVTLASTATATPTTEGVIAATNSQSAEIVRLEQRVHRGDHHAMTKLAARLQAGRGVRQDLSRAIDLYTVAAEAGVAEAQYNLGNIYLLGEGVVPDEARALTFYKQAADNGHTIASANLRQLQRVAKLPEPAPTAATEIAQTESAPEAINEPAPIAAADADPDVASEMDLFVNQREDDPSVVEDPSLVDLEPIQEPRSASELVTLDLSGINAATDAENTGDDTVPDALAEAAETAVIEDGGTSSNDVDAPPVESRTLAETSSPAGGGIGGFFKRLFGADESNEVTPEPTGVDDEALAVNEMDQTTAPVIDGDLDELANVEADAVPSSTDDEGAMAEIGTVDAADEALALAIAEERGIKIVGELDDGADPKVRQATDPITDAIETLAVDDGANEARFESVLPARADDDLEAESVAVSIGVDEASTPAVTEATVDRSAWHSIRAALEEERFGDAVPDLMLLAGSGDPDAQFQLGELHREGHGVDKDESMTITYFRQAAGNGHRIAQRELAKIYTAEGIPVPEFWAPQSSPALSTHVASTTSHPSADLDSADARVFHSEHSPAAAPTAMTELTQNEPPAGNAEEGEALTRERATDETLTTDAMDDDTAEIVDHSIAMMDADATIGGLTDATEEEIEAAKAMTTRLDVEESVPLPVVEDDTAAAKAPSSLPGLDVAEPDQDSIEQAKLALARGEFVKAARLFRLEADKGNPEAQAHLGYMYYAGEGVDRDARQAVDWYRKSAAQGNRDAQYNLGVAYAYGEGVPIDKKEAIRWYRRAADGGSSVAQYSLGVSYALGEGVPQDDGKAAEWYQKAAEGGYPAAQYNLAYAYRAGKGVTRDDAAAMRWFLRAAENGHIAAKYNIATMYQTGSGTERDREKALDWYRVAAAEGHAAARQELERMLADGN